MQNHPPILIRGSKKSRVKRALAYVEAQNAVTLKELQSKPEYPAIKQESLAILNSRERIPYVRKLGPLVLQLLARCRQSARPVAADDAGRISQGRAGLGNGSRSRRPRQDRERELGLGRIERAAPRLRALAWFLFLAAAAMPKSCASSISKRSNSSKDGFSLPEAKSEATWRDKNTLYVGTDFGPGSLTDSGYPRIVKRWKRGTPLADAPTVFEGQKTDVSASAWVDHTPGFFREGFNRSIAFYNSETFLTVGEKNVKIDVPNDAESNFFRQWLTVRLRSDWTVGGKTYKSGAMIATKLDAFLRGERKFEVLFEPSPRVSLQEVSETRNALVLNLSDNVHSRIIECRSA